MMKHIQTVRRMLGRLAIAAACWWVLYGAAWAKPAPPQEPKSRGGTWTMSYFLLILAVSLGLLVVCRSSRRRDRARPEQYKSSKMSEQYD